MSTILLLGVILLLALAGGHLVKLVKAPEIIGYLFIGMFLGPSFAELLDSEALGTLEVFAEIALGLILFTMGSVFEFGNLRRVGRRMVLLTLFVMSGTFIAVFTGMWILLGDWRPSLLLGVIATEISPIATLLVMRELDAEGPLTDVVNNVLALNNVGCILAFGLVSFLLRLVADGDRTLYSVGVEGYLFLWQTLGSIALGLLLGHILAAWGRAVNEHSEVLILVLGMLLVLVGACHWFGLSTLIATLTLGATLINVERQSRHLFDVLGKTDPPLYAIFFVLAGADMRLSSLSTMGISGIGYTLARSAGKYFGASYGAQRLLYSPPIRRYLGFTLLPHAGVAIGLVLQVRDEFPGYSEIVFTIVLASVLVNEVIGPVLTKLAIKRAGEAHERPVPAFSQL